MTARQRLQQAVAATLPRFLRMAEAGRGQLFWVDGETALVPGGHNGPYLDLESPVRNSAHWLSTMAAAFHLTGDEGFRRAGAALARYLMSASPSVDGVIVQRQRFPKDWTNGVIGPAWVSEGLSLASRHLGIEAAGAAGAANLRRLGFDDGRGLWKAFDPATGASGVDRTVNHQLYCSAIAACYPDDMTLRGRVERSIETALPKLIRTDQNGILEHHLAEPPMRRLQHAAIDHVRSGLGPRLRRAAMGHGAVTDKGQRDRGYHLFSLYAAVRLAKAANRPEVLSIPDLRAAARTLSSLTTDERYRTNDYTFAYNPPGFELPYVALSLPETQGDALMLLSLDMLQAQMDMTLEPETGLFTRGTRDPLTLSARAFELGYLHV